MAILKQCSRKKLVYAKICVLALFMIISYLCHIAFSVGCYYGFVVRTDYGTGEFISEAVRAYGIAKFIVSGVFVLIDALVTAGIVFLFSLRFKTGICFMLAIGATTLLLIMQFFPVVQYLVPTYVGSLLDYGMITPTMAGLLSLLYLAVTVVFVEITARKFERMDLK